MIITEGLRNQINKVKNRLSFLRVLIMPHAIVTYIAIVIAIVFIILSGATYETDAFKSSVYMGISTGIISGVVLLIVAGIKNMWVFEVNSEIKWLDSVHEDILQCLNKGHEYPKYSNAHNLDENYEYVYDYCADLSNINAKIVQAQFSKILPFNPTKYFLKKYMYNTYEMDDLIQELREKICNSFETEELLSVGNIRELFREVNHEMLKLNKDILRDIEKKKRDLMLANKSIV